VCLFFIFTQENSKKQLFSTNSPPTAGYGIVFDNVQLGVHRKHQGVGKSSRFLLMTSALAIKDRVLTSRCSTATTACEQMDPKGCFLPEADDFTQLRDTMIVVVERILVDHIPAYGQLGKSVTRNIPHEKSQEMQLKSNVVNLGEYDD
jgi:hypothetical protein